MTIAPVTHRTPELIGVLVALWERSVRATHAFLNEEAIAHIKTYVPDALRGVPELTLATDDADAPLAFMGVAEGRLEMLFVDPAVRDQGIGRALLEYGIECLGVDELTVNEQNPQAVGFYEHMGFSTYRRTDTDEQGDPYPLLYMKRG